LHWSELRTSHVILWVSLILNSVVLVATGLYLEDRGLQTASLAFARAKRSVWYHLKICASAITTQLGAASHSPAYAAVSQDTSGIIEDDEGEAGGDRDQFGDVELSPMSVQVAVAHSRPTRTTVLRIREVSKAFEDKRVIEELSLQLHKREALSLLGQNGAGKSTLLKMISGIVKPTSGSIDIVREGVPCSFDANPFVYRGLVGMCPQNDTLFDSLTVEEHLRLFAKIRGLQQVELEAALSEAKLDTVGLTEKRHEAVKTLSGGMKRRLSTLIALTGRCEMTLMDEPTTGVDISCRENMWKLIARLKDDTPVLVTTHSMEEAEALGDRVAIINEGRLKGRNSGILFFHASSLKPQSQ
jgi:ABC-type multidrug transport system ATPase subunit